MAPQLAFSAGVLTLAFSRWRSHLTLWPATNLLPGALTWRSLTGSVQTATGPERAALGLARSEPDIPSQSHRGSTWRPHRNTLNLALSARHFPEVGYFEVTPIGLTVAQQTVALTPAPVAPKFGGWPQPSRSRRPTLGNHMLALSDWRSQAGTIRRHVPGIRSRCGPHWDPTFGRWLRLAPAEVDLFDDRRRRSRDSCGWPHSGSKLGVATGGWPQPDRSRRPRLGNHMLALSD